MSEYGNYSLDVTGPFGFLQSQQPLEDKFSTDKTARLGKKNIPSNISAENKLPDPIHVVEPNLTNVKAQSIIVEDIGKIVEDFIKMGEISLEHVFPKLLNLRHLEESEVLKSSEILQKVGHVAQPTFALVSVIHRLRIFSVSLKTIQKLKEQNLDNPQMERLKNLEAEIRYLKSELVEETGESFFRATGHVVSFFAIGIEKSAKTGLIKFFSKIFEPLLLGLETIVLGFSLHRASQHVKIQKEQSNRLQELKNASNFTNESESSIPLDQQNAINKVKEWKTRDFENFLLSIDKENLKFLYKDDKIFLKEIEKKLGVRPSPEILKSIKDHLNRFTDLKIEIHQENDNKVDKSQLNLLVKNQNEQISELKKLAGLCVDQWFEKQDPEFIQEFFKINIKPLEDFLIKREERKTKQIESVKSKHKPPEITEKIVNIKAQATESQIIRYFNPYFMKELPPIDQVQEDLKNTLNIPQSMDLIEKIYKKMEKMNHLSILKEGNISDEHRANISNSKIKEEVLSPEFKEGIKESCKIWANNQSEEFLINEYVDYQAILDQTVKTSLAQMIEKKHEIEGSSLKLMRTTDALRFAASFICTAVLVGLTIAAFVATPVGAAALIMLILGGAASAISGGATIATIVHAFRQKPNSAYSSLRLSLKGFVDTIKLKMRQEEDQLTTGVALQYFLPEGPNAQISNQFISSEEKNHLMTQTGPLTEKDFEQIEKKREEEILEEMAWTDFAKHADINNDIKGGAFSVLETFKDAIEQADFDLLSEETKKLFKEHLGISIENLQEEINKNPFAVKNMMQKFFGLDIDEYMVMIGGQSELAKKELKT